MITEKIDGTNAAIGIVTTRKEWVAEDQTGAGHFIDVALEKPIVYAQSRTRIITPQNDNMGFARWVAENAEVLQLLGPGLHFGEWWGKGIQRGYGLEEKRFSLFNVARWRHEPGAINLAMVREKLPQVDVVPVLYEGPWTGVLGYKDGATGEWLQQPQDWPEFDRVDPTARARFDAFVDGWVEQGAPSELDREFHKLFPTNPRPRFAPNFIIEHLKRVGSQAAPGFMKPEGIVVFHKASGTSFKVTIEKDAEHKGAAR